MHPTIFIFGVGISSWYLLFAIASMATYLTAYFLLKLTGKPELEEVLPLLFTVGYLGGWLGARLLSIVIDTPEVLQSPLAFLQAWFSFGAMTFYGGAVAGALGCLTVVLAKKLPARMLFDSSLPSVVAGLGIGRIGCFLNGCDYGIPIRSENGMLPWWSHTIPIFNDNAARYPTQLEESLFSLLLAAVAVAVYYLRTKGRFPWLRPGFLGASVLLLSAANRFLNEMYRGDFRGAFPGTALTTSQGISILLMLLAITLMISFFVLDQRHQDSKEPSP